ncbi:hypothetical protein BKA62DRAFT_677135 [Auriculariales sp. MPI-PUGE-AT-0066]|nr:hypothetical protein BKA62DRAFT_677135 [Auriculariales sp. MPI-PUGE-AT-0066]
MQRFFPDECILAVFNFAEPATINTAVGVSRHWCTLGYHVYRQHCPMCSSITAHAETFASQYSVSHAAAIGRLRCDCTVKHSVDISIEFAHWILQDLTRSEQVRAFDRLRQFVSVARIYAHNRCRRLCIETGHGDVMEILEPFMAARPPMMEYLLIDFSPVDGVGCVFPAFWRLNHHTPMKCIRLSGIAFPDSNVELSDCKSLLWDQSRGALTHSVFQSFPALNNLHLLGTPSLNWFPDLATTCAIGKITNDVRMDVTSAARILMANATTFDKIPHLRLFSLKTPLQTVDSRLIWPLFGAITTDFFDIEVARSGYRSTVVEICAKLSDDTIMLSATQPLSREVAIRLQHLDQFIWPQLFPNGAYNLLVRLTFDLCLTEQIWNHLPGDAEPIELELVIFTGWRSFLSRQYLVPRTVIPSVRLSISPWMDLQPIIIAVDDLVHLLHLLFGTSIELSALEICCLHGIIPSQDDRSWSVFRRFVHSELRPFHMTTPPTPDLEDEKVFIAKDFETPEPKDAD